MDQFLQDGEMVKNWHFFIFFELRCCDQTVRLEPELELFEVWEIDVRQIIIIANGINSQTPKLQRALARVLDKLERN